MEADRNKIRQFEIDGTSARQLKQTRQLAQPRQLTQSERTYRTAGAAAQPEQETSQPRRQRETSQPRRQTEREARYEERRRQRERRQEQQQRLAPRSAAPAIDFGAMVILTLAIAVTFWTCISYLQVQADISAVNKETARLTAATEKLATKNDYTELMIQNSIDLAEVQRVAMEELGMVYPYNNQMITYKMGENGYVRQYGELIGNEQESVIEMLMRMLMTSKKQSITEK